MKKSQKIGIGFKISQDVLAPLKKDIIMQVPIRSGSSYFSYKDTHGTVLMAVCDSLGSFYFILARVGEVMMVEYFLIVILEYHLKAKHSTYPNHPF